MHLRKDESSNCEFSGLFLGVECAVVILVFEGLLFGEISGCYFLHHISYRVWCFFPIISMVQPQMSYLDCAVFPTAFMFNVVFALGRGRNGCVHSTGGVRVDIGNWEKR